MVPGPRWPEESPGGSPPPLSGPVTSRQMRRRKGNVYLRRILCEIAQSAARTRDAQFGPYKQGLAIRRGTGRAVVATAHKILRIVFAMLRDGKPYRDPQVDYQARTAIRNKARWLKMLRKANLWRKRLPSSYAACRSEPVSPVTQ